MDYRLLGRTGVRVSPICIGTMNFGSPTPDVEAARIIDRALDAGVNFFDTANSYNAGESEAVIGRALAASGRRQELILATKAHFPTGPGPNERGNSRLHLMRACEDSLRRLQTDHIDLYQMHRPDPHTPVEETLAALSDLVRQGKVRYVGCSTHPAWRVMEALMVSELKGHVRYVSEQPPYNLLDRRIENELLPLCQAHGLAIIPWSPLAQGVLAGRYADAAKVPADSRAALRGGIYAERVTARGIAVGDQFVALARAHGIAPARLALLWAKDQPGITAPIFGPRTLAQLDEILPVCEMSLSDELRAACDALVPPGSAVVNFHNTAGWMKMRIS
ncbi:aldo/keto reductase [Oscillochloris sp. ZM17-4]|uniref:aldo/keto reductase n=1 Tax=Oscillochloris sp. ZM17-4 TaxID=2866714 RepID=UPI001C72A8B1|nr:aldo/keto reductase [Oscillochloris sp. ZM17-4]MBX0329578.1 aldo/keto reductase [Oscillochloris sp. ZM17-4]